MKAGWMEGMLKTSLEHKRYIDLMLYVFHSIWKIFSTELSI